MPKCTAPVKGHRSAAARRECPVCGVHTGAARAVAPTHVPSPRGTSSAGGSGTKAATAANQSARQTGSTASADLVVWIVLARIVHDHVWLLLLGLIAVAVPAALASQWTYQCSAWINDGTARCRRPRAGFMRRCHDHRHAMITNYDVAAGAAATVAVINLLILIARLTPLLS